MSGGDLKQRTKVFALRIVRVVRVLPNSIEGRCIGNQLFRSGTSVAANYRAVCRAKSKADFIAKLGIVIEEADETAFWLELIVDLAIINREKLIDLLQEANEILAIMIASAKSAKNNN